LQAQTTNDLNTLKEWGSQNSSLIDRKARPVGCYKLFNLGSEYAIICDTNQANAILEHLEKYRFADKVDFEIASDVRFLSLQGRASLAVLDSCLAEEEEEGTGLKRGLFERDYWSGRIAGTKIEIFRYTLTGEEGFLILVKDDRFTPTKETIAKAAASLGLEPLTPPILECARVEAGLSKLGTDFSGENLLAETNLDESSVSYNKGCFQGQEVLARIKGQGSPSRSLVGLIIEPSPATPFPIDTPIEVAGETIGWMKSNCYSQFLHQFIAIAMFKRDHRTPGKSFHSTINGTDFTIKVETLPFFTAPSPSIVARELYEKALSVFAGEDETKKETQDWQSITLLREAVLLDPLFEDAYESLGVILNRRGATDEAIEVMLHLAKLNPDSAMAHTNLSVFYVEKGWKEKAEEEMAISMSIRMREAASQFSKDKEAEEERKKQQAETLQRMSMFEQVLEIDPEDQLANYGYGDCLVALDRFEEAVPHLQKAIRLKPSHSVAYVSLGRAFEGLNRLEEARSTYLDGIDAAARRGDGEPMKKMKDRLSQLS
jgi:folate-binding protein YgfZ